MGQTFTRFDEQEGNCLKLNFREPARHFPLILIYATCSKPRASPYVPNGTCPRDNQAVSQ